MKRRVNLIRSIDWITVLLYLVLIFFGWLNIYAAVYNEQHRGVFDLSQRHGKQMAWIIAAVILAAMVFLIDVKFFSFFAWLIYGLSVLSLILVLVFGREIHGSRSWFGLGSFYLQPGEFAKIATALALAKYMSAYNFKIDQAKVVFTLIFLILFPSLLIALQPDMGSAIIFFSFVLVVYREGFSIALLLLGILFIGLFFLSLLIDKFFILTGLLLLSLIIFYLSGNRIKLVISALLILILSTAIFYGLNYLLAWDINNYYVMALGFLFSIPVYAMYAFRKRLKYIFVFLGITFVTIIYAFSVDYVFHEVLEVHQQHRVNILLGIESDPLGTGYNINQSKIAIGSGGFTGKGFLNGTQTKYDFVPEQSTDFIFCTVGEEWGFIGTFLVVALFIFLLLRLIWIAERQRSEFSRIYGYGVVAVIFTHITINIGMTIGLFPVVGIPLPFFSYGGSSLWAFTLLLFIMLRLDASRMELLR